MKFKIKLLAIAITLINIPYLYSQNFSFEYDFLLEEVMFHSPVDALSPDWIKIKNDAVLVRDNNNVVTGIQDGNEISGNDRTIVYSFQDGLLTSKPVAYVSGTKGGVSAKFRTKCKEKLWIKAITSNGEKLPWRKAVQISEGVVGYPTTAFKDKFPEGMVQYRPQFTLKWIISTERSDRDNPDNHKEVAESKNPLYILHSTPLDAHLSNSKFYEWSLIDIACRNANGKSNPIEIVDLIYHVFKSKDVKRVNKSTHMTYWGGTNITNPNVADICFSYEGLFAFDDATCEAWVDLFYNTIVLHGIIDPLPKGENVKLHSVASVYVSNYNTIPPFCQPEASGDGGATPEGAVVFESSMAGVPVNQSEVDHISSSIQELFSGVDSSKYTWTYAQMTSIESPNDGAFKANYVDFLVKIWDLARLPAHNIIHTEVDGMGRGNIGRDGIDFVPPPEITLSNGNVIPYLGEEGIGAQGSLGASPIENIRSEFALHAVMPFNGKIYDPSYGTNVSNSENEWETNSIDGISTKILISVKKEISGTTMDYDKKVLVYLDENTSQPQTKFCYKNGID